MHSATTLQPAPDTQKKFSSAPEKTHFRNLDALRFLAFLGVFLFHFIPRLSSVSSDYTKPFLYLFQFGNLGVNFFFVLSGFLITYLLLEEEKTNSTYNIPNFWIRRVLRIWPLYFATVIYGFFIFKLLNHNNPGYHEPANIWYYLSFLPNFNLIENGYPLNTSLTVLWSVGIEEQFYLFWPLLMLIKPARKYMMAALLIICIAFRWWNQNDHFVILYHTLSLAGDLVAGSALALVAFNKKIPIQGLRINRVLSSFIYFAALAIIFSNIFSLFNELLFLKNFILSLLFCAILFEQCFASAPLIPAGNFKMFSKLGKYTYGMYCIHPLGIMIGYYLSRFLRMENNIAWISTVEFAAALLSTIVLARISYRYLEKPFLKMKSSYYGQRTAEAKSRV